VVVEIIRHVVSFDVCHGLNPPFLLLGYKSIDSELPPLTRFFFFKTKKITAKRGNTLQGFPVNL